MDLVSLWNNDKKVKSLTGLKKSELNLIANSFFKEIVKEEGSRGRPRKLSNENLLILLLTQYKHNMTFDLLGVMFDIDLSNAKRWIDRVEGILQSILKKKNYCHLIPTTPRKKQESDFSLEKLCLLMEKNSQ